MSIEEAERWLEEHGNALYSFALVHLRDADRAEDAVQETLLAALQARGNYRGSASVRTWLIGILKHKIVDEFRRQARDPAVDGSEEVAWERAEAARVEHEFNDAGRWTHPLSEWGNPERHASGRQFWELIERCLAALSPRAARLFVLRDLWEMDADAVCKELSITPSNLWTSLHRARLGMRQCLAEEGLG
ncbi:MAG: sigma-70 family RNA polymerase sigma factor [Gammaproteobacteria bacterium]